MVDWLKVTLSLKNLCCQLIIYLYLSGKQSVQPQPQPSELTVPQASDSTDDITRHSSSSSFQVLSRSSSSSSSVAGVSSHGSDGPSLVPQGNSGILGTGILEAAFGSGGVVTNAAERVKTDLAPTLVLKFGLIFCFEHLGTNFIGFLLSNETVVLRRWESKAKIGFYQTSWSKVEWPPWEI